MGCRERGEGTLGCVCVCVCVGGGGGGSLRQAFPVPSSQSPLFLCHFFSLPLPLFLRLSPPSLPPSLPSLSPSVSTQAERDSWGLCWPKFLPTSEEFRVYWLIAKTVWNFNRYVGSTLLPSIFMTGVHPPAPQPKSPNWHKTEVGLESKVRLTSWLTFDLSNIGTYRNERSSWNTYIWTVWNDKLLTPFPDDLYTKGAAPRIGIISRSR